MLFLKCPIRIKLENARIRTDKKFGSPLIRASRQTHQKNSTK
jgi:hypothetical protein